MTGTDLRALRERLGLSQNKLARAMQVDSSNLSAMELGKRPVPEAVARAAVALEERVAASDRILR